MRPVTSLDAGLLYAETPEMPLHTIGVVVVDPPDGGEPLFRVLRRRIEERLHLLPPLRRRLVQGPLQLGDPHWIEDPAFDLDNHLRRAAAAPPGSLHELAEFVGDFAGRLLERTKPLWEVVVVEGLEGGRVAVVAKVHHAAMDGGQMVARLLGNLFDLGPEGRRVPPAEQWRPDPEPSLAWFAADTARSLAARPVRAIRGMRGVAAAAGHLALAHCRRRGAAASLFEGPPTPLNGALTPHRAVAFTDVAFDDFKLVKRAFGATINDVVLAVSASALRSWLRAHGHLPERPLVVNVPVAVRGDGQEDAGNRISMILVHLPIHVDDPVERLLAIRAETARAKSDHRRSHADVLEHFTEVVTGIAVPWVLTRAMALYSAARLADRLPLLWNLVISNVPGPPVPLWCGTARVVRVYPLGPVQHGSGLNLTVLSVMDRLCVGAMACKELVPDLDDLAAAFVEGTDELKTLATRARPLPSSR